MVSPRCLFKVFFFYICIDNTLFFTEIDTKFFLQCLLDKTYRQEYRSEKVAADETSQQHTQSNLVQLLCCIFECQRAHYPDFSLLIPL